MKRSIIHKQLIDKLVIIFELLEKSHAKEDNPESKRSFHKGDFVYYKPSQVYGVISDVQWKANRIRMLTIDGKPAPELGDKKEHFEQVIKILKLHLSKAGYFTQFF